MICQNCKKNIATSLVSCETVTGHTYTMALCDECKNRISKQNNTISHCSRCGATLNDLTSGKVQFCPECYSSFGEKLSDYMTKIHGSSIHKGKRPNYSAPNTGSHTENKRMSFNRTVEKLRLDLDAAIHDERYEDAAQIRDELRKIQEVDNNGR